MLPSTRTTSECALPAATATNGPATPSWGAWPSPLNSRHAKLLSSLRPSDCHHLAAKHTNGPVTSFGGAWPYSPAFRSVMFPFSFFPQHATLSSFLIPSQSHPPAATSNKMRAAWSTSRWRNVRFRSRMRFTMDRAPYTLRLRYFHLLPALYPPCFPRFIASLCSFHRQVVLLSPPTFTCFPALQRSFHRLSLLVSPSPCALLIFYLLTNYFPC